MDNCVSYLDTRSSVLLKVCFKNYDSHEITFLSSVRSQKIKRGKQEVKLEFKIEFS